MPGKSRQTFRQIDYQALVSSVAGPEKPVVVYRFGDRRVFTQRPEQTYYRGDRDARNSQDG